VLGAAATAGAIAALAANAAPAAARTTERGGPEHGGPERGALALTHASVIDGTGAPPRPDTTVIVAGGRIVAVGSHHELGTRLPAGVSTMDLTGKFLIAGLCDMHVHHSSPDIDPALFIANGVTTVRDMWGLPVFHDWRREIEAGRMVGPRMVIGSPIIDGTPTLWDANHPRPAPPDQVTTADDARRVVRQVLADGADFVKVYSRVPEVAFRALADEARRRRAVLVGHCPDTVPLTEAGDAGMRSFEHLFGMWFATSAREREIRRSLAALTVDPPNPYDDWFHKIHALEWRAAGAYQPAKAAAVFHRLAAQGSWQVPTLSMLRVLDMPDRVPPPSDPRFAYVPPDVVTFWQSWVRALDRTPTETVQRRELFPRLLRLVGDLRRAGVRIMAGTDTGTTYLFPGFSLHDELALLVKAGLTPMEALQAATVEPARFLGRQASAGTVEPGRNADLVVLDANPLADIHNTTKIHSVVARGRLIPPDQRARLLAGAARAAQRPPGAAPATFRRVGVGCGCGYHGPRLA
jgi:imidazolonepropionase-like amidohydrolase